MHDFPKTFSLTENQFSGKTYFYTIASSRTTGPTLPTARNQAKVLLIPQSTYSTTFKTVVETLVYNRVKYKSSVSGKNLPGTNCIK